MKLEQNIILYIKQAVTIAHMLGVNDMIIEDGLVRAMPEDRSVLLVHKNERDLPFDIMGITRIPQFLNRLKIVMAGDDFSIDVKEHEGEVRSLVMKCNGTTIDFKCSNPSKIIAPRKITDRLMYGIDISSESIGMLKRSEPAMKADIVTIISNDNGVSFKLNDVNNDTFEHQVSESITLLDKTTSNLFAFKYPTKLLIALLKNNITYFEIAEQGTLKLNIDGFDVFILPRI